MIMIHYSGDKNNDNDTLVVIRIKIMIHYSGDQNNDNDTL